MPVAAESVHATDSVQASGEIEVGNHPVVELVRGFDGRISGSIQGAPSQTLDIELKRADLLLPVAALVVGLIAVSASCSHTEKQSDPESQPDETAVVKMPMNLNGQIDFSIKDLAKRLDVSPDSIKVSGARRVTWRSGALGCPKPGISYTDALVPGSVIYLQVDNAIHAYHGKIGSEPFYCPRERAEQPVLDDDRDPT